MDKIPMLAFHPVKMQSCYEKVEQLSLEGLQQRFDVSSASVFTQRAQVLMREVRTAPAFTWAARRSFQRHAGGRRVETVQHEVTDQTRIVL